MAEKPKRVMLDLNQKIEIIKRLKKGETATSIAHCLRFFCYSSIRLTITVPPWRLIEVSLYYKSRKLLIRYWNCHLLFIYVLC
jgi:hypothetical protein